MATDIAKYFSFVLSMFIVFGIAVVVPVVEVLLVKIGLVTVQQLKDVRRYVIVGIFIVAAVVTPPDVFSQLALAIPLCILYELGIILAKFLGKPIVEDENKREMSEADHARGTGRARDQSFMLNEVVGDELFFQGITRQGRTIDAGVIQRQPKPQTETPPR